MLEGKSILIGKEPGKGRLLIAVKQGGNTKTALIGDAGTVPNTVSRCIPAQDIGHCRLTIGEDSVMVLTNLKPQNVTYVDGMEIVSKRVTRDSHITLGPDKYVVSLARVLDAAEKLVGTPAGGAAPSKEVKTYNISHLKRIWTEYSDRKVNMQIQERKINAISAVSGVISSAGLVCAFIPSLAEIRILSLVVVVLFGLAFFFIRLKRSNAPEEQRRQDDIFQDEYVCPHCKHHFGQQSYKLVLRGGACPRCKSKFVE